MKVVAVYSIKGGVGKTTCAANLAYLAAQSPARTLLWDLDAQGASSFYFRLEDPASGATAKILEKSSRMTKYVRSSDYEGLDVMRADSSSRVFDLLLAELKKPKKGLHRALKAARDDYDFTFLDCPPGLSLLAENVLRTSSAVVVPVIPTTLSVRTLDQLRAFCEKKSLDVPLWPFLSMVDRRKRLHVDLAESLRNQWPAMLEAQVPYASAVEQMAVHRAPIATYARWMDASRAFELLWREIERRLAGKE